MDMRMVGLERLVYLNASSLGRTRRRSSHMTSSSPARLRAMHSNTLGRSTLSSPDVLSKEEAESLHKELDEYAARLNGVDSGGTM